MAESKFYNNFMVKRGYNKKGEEIVDGAIEIRLSKAFNSGNMVDIRNVEVAGKTKSVAQLQGSFKVGEYQAKQFKYFYNQDVPVDSYINVQVAIWGNKADAIAKFNIAEGDIYLFLLSDVKFETFQKKDNSQGSQLKATAFEFKPLRANKAGDAGAPAQASASKASSMEDDFNSIDDSDDLPF